jgi:DNA-binding NtrC family response regulator
MTTPVENAASRTILVVDDDPQIRKSLHKILCAEGYEVALAPLYGEEIEQSNTRRIDLVMLDLNLPGDSGWHILKSLTVLDPSLPIIITGRQNQSELAAAMGVSTFMEKPLHVPMLLKTIAELLDEEPDMRVKRLLGQISATLPNALRTGHTGASWQTTAHL